MSDGVWAAVRGGSAPKPEAFEIGRRYVEILTDNFGQPGFRELLIGVHDLDARRDLVGAVLPQTLHDAFTARRKASSPREAEIVDFASASQRGLVIDFLVGALRLPIASAAHAV